jgi:phosphatidate phosphatase PAH1
MSATYAGPPPPASSLGAWLLKKVEEVGELIGSLVVGQSEQKAAVDQLRETVSALKRAAEKSAKVQNVQATELEQIKAQVRETQKQLNGLKISRGRHKAKAQRLLSEMDRSLH